MIGAVVLRDGNNEIISISVELMDLKEAARYLKLNYETVRLWAKAGKIPAFKTGGLWRIRRSDLEDWIDEHKVGRGIE